MKTLEGITWLCEWCSTEDVEAFVTKSPEKCKILGCKDCGCKTWHAPSNLIEE